MVSAPQASCAASCGLLETAQISAMGPVGLPSNTFRVTKASNFHMQPSWPPARSIAGVRSRGGVCRQPGWLQMKVAGLWRFTATTSAATEQGSGGGDYCGGRPGNKMTGQV